MLTQHVFAYMIIRFRRKILCLFAAGLLCLLQAAYSTDVLTNKQESSDASKVTKILVSKNNSAKLLVDVELANMQVKSEI